MTWLQLAWGLFISALAFLLTAIVAFAFSLPTPYSHSHKRFLTDEDFPETTGQSTTTSGHDYFTKYKDDHGRLEIDTSVQIVVLGDIGRSPRMQYHALSLASYGSCVDMIGYQESDVHDDIQKNRFIKVVPIQPFPRPPNSKLLFLFFAPFKIVYQVWSLYYTLAYRTRPAKWMLIQNPPSIPILAICRLVCYLRNTRLVIDWHNYGYTILALRLGSNHPLVRIARWYEGLFSAHGVHAHFAVTNAMVKDLQRKFNIQNAICLHDRPAEIYQPLHPLKRAAILHRLPETASHAEAILAQKCRLLISSTSWTPDEDFQILLDALVQYSSQTTTTTTTKTNKRPLLPPLLAIITGKGPQKQHYLSLIATLTRQNRLQNVTVKTAWLSAQDYALLLGAADLGVSLHTSSSGVDLPMKVVDMFGTGLPVVGYGGYEAWDELVREGENGRGFTTSEGLAGVLMELFGEEEGRQLKKLREGAMRECERRWKDEWWPVAGKVFELKT